MLGYDDEFEAALTELDAANQFLAQQRLDLHCALRRYQTTNLLEDEARWRESNRAYSEAQDRYRRAVAAFNRACGRREPS